MLNLATVKRVLVAATFSAAGVQGIFAESRGTGSFLNLDVGARHLALAETSVALPDDSFAVYANPAGLARQKQASVQFHQHELIDPVRSMGGLATIPIGSGGISLAYNGMTYGSLNSTDVNGMHVGSFEPKDSAASVGMGLPLTRRSSVGLAGRLFRSEIEEFEAESKVLDLGIQGCDYLISGLRLGLAVRNAATFGDFEYDGVKEDLSRAIHVGAWWSSPSSKRWNIGAEYTSRDSADAFYSLGLEAWAIQMQQFTFALRGGFTSKRSDLGDMGGISVGAGARWGIVNLDWAWIPYGDTGLTQAATVGLQWGGRENVGASVKETHSEPAVVSPADFSAAKGGAVESSSTRTLYLKDGSILRGKLVIENEKFVGIEFDKGWKKIPRSKIEHIQ